MKEASTSDGLAAKDIEAHLFTAELPDVNLVIRTGGDTRLSNFLLWQSAYAIVYVVDNYWPALTAADIEAGIRYYNQVMAKMEIKRNEFKFC